MIQFKPEAKVYRVRIDVEVVAIDRQDATDAAISAWQNGGNVGDTTAAQPDRAPQDWMVCSDYVREHRAPGGGA